jgi:hypothetical protein
MSNPHGETELNPNRTKYFKGAMATLSGPHHGTHSGNPYLPGSVHRVPLEHLDTNPMNSCAFGLYFTSHVRVAGRWAPVVLEVEVPKTATKIRTDDRHIPTHVPVGVDTGSYNKYRTDQMVIRRIVGVAAYGLSSEANHRPDLSPAVRDAFPYSMGSYAAAIDVVTELNQTLAAHGQPTVQLTGNRLERLRDDRFCVWETAEQVVGATSAWRVDVELTLLGQRTPAMVEAMVEKMVDHHAWVQGVTAHAKPRF